MGTWRVRGMVKVDDNNRAWWRAAITGRLLDDLY